MIVVTDCIVCKDNKVLMVQEGKNQKKNAIKNGIFLAEKWKLPNDQSKR